MTEARDRPARIEQLITLLVRSAPASDPAVIDELVGEQLVAPGIALPPLAMACATLADGVHGKLGDRELEAARFEIETLMPMPDRPPAIAAPDVPLSALRKRPR